MPARPEQRPTPPASLLIPAPPPLRTLSPPSPTRRGGEDGGRQERGEHGERKERGERGEHGKCDSSRPSARPRLGIVLGNGPSLDRLPRTVWEGLARAQAAGRAAVLGVNRGLVVAALVENRFPLRRCLLLDHPRDLDSAGGTPGCYAAWRENPAGVRRIGADRTGEADEYVRIQKEWSDTSGVVGCRHSVAAAACNLLALEGCRRLVLLGVDYLPGYCRLLASAAGFSTGKRPSPVVPSPVAPSSPKKEARRPGDYSDRLGELESAWAKTAVAAAARGVELVNASPGARLRAVRRVAATFALAAY